VGVLRLLLLAGGVAACADLVSPSQGAGVILPAAADLLVMIRSIDDASDRVTPTLGSGSAAGELRASLDALNAALGAADAPSADKALTRANAALTAFKASSEIGNATAPDASVVEIVLLYIEASMRRPCESFPGAALVDPGITRSPTVAYSCK
jgi:hypothetical protein